MQTVAGESRRGKDRWEREANRQREKERGRQTRREREREKKKERERESWCFEPSQPQRIILGLKANFSLFPSYSIYKSLNHRSLLFVK